MSKTTRLSKRLRSKYNIEKVAKEKRLVALLKKRSTKKKSFNSIVTALYNRENVCIRLNKEQKYIRTLFEKCKAKEKRKRRVFYEILIFLDKNNCNKLLKEELYLRGILQMAKYSPNMLQAFNTWVRKSHNPSKQFSSFLHHCYVKYEMPLFMNAVWFDLHNTTSINWFLDIGRGHNLRKCQRLPIEVTKKISHYFMKAPADFTLHQALRWAQVLGIGGNEAIANHVVSSQLGRNRFVNERFFKTVIQYLILNAGMLVREKIHQLIDYIFYAVENDRTYSIKGRSINNLIQLSDEWHFTNDYSRTLGKKVEWDKCGVSEYKIEVPVKINKDVSQSETYYLIEILSAKALSDEGRKMHHCVGSYARACARKRCAIFSLRLKTALCEEKRLGTIEVDLKSKSIAQAKAKYNAKVKPKAMKVLEDWAKIENLTISRFL